MSDEVDERYEDLGPIGEGAMGEVRRMFDVRLNRTVAMKILRHEWMDRDDIVARFIEESQAAAQLEHPFIVPVFDTGVCADGRPYFTMREVRGRSLTEVIEEVHSVSHDRWEVSPTGFSFRKLVDSLQRVAEAVHYAHTRGVVHRDLKPDNVNLGPFGEVQLLDWGLAKVRTAALRTNVHARGAHQSPVVTEKRARTETQHGHVTGTPAYMAPEQARGEIGRIGPWTDVYALGSMLWQILSEGAPFGDLDVEEIIDSVASGRTLPPPGRRPGPVCDPVLVELVEKATAHDLARRIMDAGVFAESLGRWLEGSDQRQKALSFVARADELIPKIGGLRQEAFGLRVEARRLLDQVPGNADADQKKPAWILQDRAAGIEAEAGRDEFAAIQLLQGALIHDPTLPEAHARLSRLAVTDTWGPDRRASSVPQDRPGRIDLATRPFAEVAILRYEEIGRRLVPMGGVGNLPETPIEGVEVPPGSYLLRLRAPGRAPVHYPVSVGPGEQWSPRRAGQDKAPPIYLPGVGELGPVDCYVPAGWARIGGDPDGLGLPGERSFVEAFVMRRFPVTNREFLRFLQGLAHEGKMEEARGFAPHWGQAALRGEDEWREGDGHVWDPEMPVRFVSFDAALAFAAWQSAQTGQPWRLPSEVEWEKAARGVDGRLYPWGNHFDPSFCNMEDSHGGEPGPGRVDAFPVDSSPYGVRGLAGNIRAWCWSVDGLPGVVRGGWWAGGANLTRSTARQVLRAAHAGVGLRLVRSLTAQRGQ